MIRIAIAGATGRMGQMVVKEVVHHPKCELVAALARSGNPFVGQDIGHVAGLSPMDLEITDNIGKAVEAADVIIDFSKPDGTLAILTENQNTPLVTCVTGFNEKQLEQLEAASSHLPILHAPNTSLGAAVIKKVSKQIAQALGPEFDIELMEMHHRNKVDAPSGTVSELAYELAQVPGFHINPKSDRTGIRQKGAIQYVISRGGGVIADHQVMYAGEKEVITLSHRALDRSLFAAGAMKAAQWLQDKEPGFYTMEDVLSL